MSADGTRVILAVERWGLDNACLSGFSGRAERGEGDKPWKIAARECEEEAKGIFGSASELEETLHRVNYFDTWGRNVRSQFRFYFPTVDESLFEPHRPDEACVCVDCHFKSIDKADCEKTDLKIIEVAELLRAYDELGSFDWENPQNNPAVFVTSLSGDLLQLRPVFTRCLPYLAKEQMRR